MREENWHIGSAKASLKNGIANAPMHNCHTGRMFLFDCLLPLRKPILSSMIIDMLLKVFENLSIQFADKTIET